jgi:hypothetical protein
VAKKPRAGCPLAERRLKHKSAKRRDIIVQEHGGRLAPYLARFLTPEGERDDYARGPAVETVFAFIRRCAGRFAGNAASLLKASYHWRPRTPPAPVPADPKTHSERTHAPVAPVRHQLRSPSLHGFPGERGRGSASELGDLAAEVVGVGVELADLAL